MKHCHAKNTLTYTDTPAKPENENWTAEDLTTTGLTNIEDERKQQENTRS